MNRPRTSCQEIEPDLVAAAAGEAEQPAVRRVEHHVGICTPCRRELDRYRAIEGVVGAIRREPAPAAPAVHARKRLESRLDDLRRRSIAYRIFPSPLGHILVALSERGVSLVEYLGARGDVRHSRLARLPGVEAVEDSAETEALERELLEYLAGRRTQLEWPIDLRLVKSAFHRRVLEATAAIPYGAVMSYSGLACEVGKPSAPRAVAQALRWNPVPIVVPCHRVIGASGALTGYAGSKIALKQRLLATEGVCTVKAEGALTVSHQAMYVRYPGDPEYCLPTCPSIVRAEQPRRFLYFGSREHAEAAGLAPCTTCRPDLHPITQ